MECNSLSLKKCTTWPTSSILVLETLKKKSLLALAATIVVQSFARALSPCYQELQPDRECFQKKIDFFEEIDCKELNIQTIVRKKLNTEKYKKR